MIRFPIVNSVLSMTLLCLVSFSPATAQYRAALYKPTGFSETFGYGTAGNQQIGSGSGSATGGNTHALLWSGNESNYIDLNPSGYDGSSAYSTDGVHQVGIGYQGSEQHAMLWSGSAAGAVDLNPANFGYSFAYGVDGNQQVGGGTGTSTGGGTHALLWNGTASSVVDLHPGGVYEESTAYRIHNGMIAGVGITNTLYHAMTWSGTADSFIDLHPAGYDESVASGVADGMVVGYAYGTATGGSNHALLWHGGAEDYTDLNPAGYSGSFAYQTNGSEQAGLGVINGEEHAMVWSSTAASAVDLHSLLPSGYLFSQARGIAADGSIFGYAYDGTSYSAVRWTPNAVPAPEASATALMGFGAMFYVLQRRRKTREKN